MKQDVRLLIKKYGVRAILEELIRYTEGSIEELGNEKYLQELKSNLDFTLHSYMDRYEEIEDEKVSKIKFKYYLHDDGMLTEVMENLSDHLPEDVDLELVATKVKDFCYEVGIVFEWDTDTNQLNVLGVE